MTSFISLYFKRDFGRSCNRVGGLDDKKKHASVYATLANRLVFLSDFSSWAVRNCSLNIQTFMEYNIFAIHLACCIASGAINRGGIITKKDDSEFK